jgi:hypothetical protein
MLVISNLATIILSASIGSYLFFTWFRQENRMTSDLPLVFAISLAAQAINTFILMIANVGIAEMTMELFRIRSIVIGGSVIPVIGTILAIWAPRKKKYHNWAIIASTVYWIGVAVLGTSQPIIMSLHMPLLIGSGLMMMVTFIITWKTGRLKEVRSDFIVVSILFGVISQLSRVPTMTTSLFFVPDIVLALSMIFIVIGLSNPWYKREMAREEAPPPEPMVAYS